MLSTSFRPCRSSRAMNIYTCTTILPGSPTSVSWIVVLDNKHCLSETQGKNDLNITLFSVTLGTPTRAKRSVNLCRGWQQMCSLMHETIAGSPTTCLILVVDQKVMISRPINWSTNIGNTEQGGDYDERISPISFCLIFALILTLAEWNTHMLLYLYS